MPTIEILEFVPIILAIIAIVFSALQMRRVRRTSDMIACILSVIGGILLIIAQTSWWVSAVIEHNLLGTWFSNQVWLVFNSIMMVVIILHSSPRSKK